MNKEKRIHNELSKITQKHKYTNEQLAKKIIANCFLEPLKNPTNFFYCPEIAEETTRIGYEKLAEMYDELSKTALKSKCTIIVPTQPNSEHNYIVPQEFKDNPDILVIDYFDKI